MLKTSFINLKFRETPAPQKLARRYCYKLNEGTDICYVRGNTTSTEPMPSESSTEPQDTKEPQPILHSTEPQPILNSTDPKPSDVSTEPQSSDISTEPQDTETSTEPQPNIPEERGMEDFWGQ